ncbi:hypothetical protein ABK040_003161 [Willaertia magna]
MPSLLLETLQQEKISSLFNKQEYSDLVIQTLDGKSYNVLKALLIPYSEEFEEMFSKKDDTSTTLNELTLDKIVTNIALEMFLKVVYFGKITNYTLDNYIDLLLFAHQYKMKEMEEKCASVFKEMEEERYSEENYSQLLEKIEKYNDESHWFIEVKKSLMVMITSNFDEKKLNFKFWWFMLNSSQWNSVLGLDLTLTTIFEFLPNGLDFMNFVVAIKDKEIYKQLISEIARYGIWNQRTVFIDDLSKEESKKLLKFLIEEIISQKKHCDIPHVKLCVKSSVGDCNHLIKGMSRMKELEFENVKFKHSQLRLLIENPYCKVEQLFLNNSHLEPNFISNSTKMVNTTLKHLKIVNDKEVTYTNGDKTEIKKVPFCYDLNASFPSLTKLSVDQKNYISLDNSLIRTHYKQFEKLNLKKYELKYHNYTFDNVKEITFNVCSTREIYGAFPHIEKLNVSHLLLQVNDVKLETVKELTVKSAIEVKSFRGVLASLIEKVAALFPNLTKFTISDEIVKYMYSYNIVDTKKDPVAVSKREIDILEFQYPEITLAENKLKNITIIHSKEANKVVLHGLKRELQMLCPSTLIDLKAGNGKSYSFYDWNSIKEIVPVELYKLYEEICKLEMSDTTNVLQNEFIGKFIACAYPIDSKAYVPRLMVLLNQLTNLFSYITHYTEDVVNKQRETLEIYLSLIGKHDDFSQELERNINNLELITKKYGKGLFKDLKLTSQDKEAIVEIINNIKVVTNQIYDKGHSLYPNEKLFIKEEWHSDNFIECFDGLDDEGIEIEVEDNVTFDELEDNFEEESEEEECDEEIDGVNSTLSKRSFESMEPFESNKKIKI